MNKELKHLRSPALLAFEDLSLSVHGHVLPEVGVGGERLVALGAGERLDLLVNSVCEREKRSSIKKRNTSNSWI